MRWGGGGYFVRWRVFCEVWGGVYCEEDMLRWGYIVRRLCCEVGGIFSLNSPY